MRNRGIVESRYRKDLEVILSHPKCKIVLYSMLPRIWFSLILSKSAETILYNLSKETIPLLNKYACDSQTQKLFKH